MSESKKYCPKCITLTASKTPETQIWTCATCGWSRDFGDDGSGGVREPRVPKPQPPKRQREKVPIPVSV